MMSRREEALHISSISKHSQGYQHLWRLALAQVPMSSRPCPNSNWKNWSPVAYEYSQMDPLQLMTSKSPEAAGRLTLTSEELIHQLECRQSRIIGKTWPSLSSIDDGISVESIPTATTEEQSTEHVSQDMRRPKLSWRACTKVTGSILPQPKMIDIYYKYTNI